MHFGPDQIQRHAIAQRRVAVAQQVQARSDRAEALRELCESRRGHVRQARVGQRRGVGDSQVVGVGNRARPGLVHLVDDTGDVDQAGGRGRRATAVAGDELEASRARPHVQRLQDAVLLDRLHQRLDLTRVDRARRVDVAERQQPHVRRRATRRGQLIDVVSVVSHAEAGRKPLTRERVLGRERGLEFGIGREAVGTDRRDKRRNAGARTFELGHRAPSGA